MSRLVLLALLAGAACAQTPTDKPDAVPDDRQRRADSVITRGEGTDLGGVHGAPVTRTDSAVVEVGDRPVVVRTHVVAGPDGTTDAFWAVNLHDDEDTSVAAALAVAAEMGGTVVELVHTGERNLRFAVDVRDPGASGGRRAAYGADPNRMFTPAGLARTVASLTEGPTPSLDHGERAVERLARYVLTQTGLGDADVVVTLHNNTEDNYSARSYEPGAVYATDAAAVTVHEGSDPDDFFFVTDRALYDALVARGFNAVLQDNDAATDDGSLSVWAAQNGRPYVNVEAQHGHLEAQTEMIRALVEVLRDGS